MRSCHLRGYQLPVRVPGRFGFQVHGGGRDLVVAVRLKPGFARDVEEILGGEVVGSTVLTVVDRLLGKRVCRFR